MTDQHREPAETSSTTKGRLRPVLWLVLAVSALDDVSPPWSRAV
jgi:hypothetical protein